MNDKIVPNLLRRPTRIEPAPEPIASPSPDHEGVVDFDPPEPETTTVGPAPRASKKNKKPRTKRVADENMERVSWRIRDDLLTRVIVYLASHRELTREDVINAALEMWLKAKKA